MAADVVIYVTNYCPYCNRAKRLFDGKGVSYDVIDVTDDSDKRAWLMEETGQRTVPQIFVNDESLGGFTDVRALDKEGVLDEKLGLA